MRKLLLVAVLMLLAAPSWAAGSIAVTSTSVGSDRVLYTLAWTSDAGAGTVSGHALDIRAGNVLAVEFVPGSGGTQPTDLYDVQLQDPFNVDLLNDGTTAQGGNLSNSTSKVIQWATPYYYTPALGSLELVISGAGNSKTGTVYLLIGQ